MAVRNASSTTNDSLEFIMKLHQVRDKVRDDRMKRLKRDGDSSTRLTYHSGQKTSFAQPVRRKK